ncbi:MAG TPA: hypothetical protein VHA52_07645, partial [Candidatus Babeliaceae bacterium]|nr:hypothetical protein [Candidatus Babeliaceae bacterium]
KLEIGISGALSIRLRELEVNEENDSSPSMHLIYWESYVDATTAMSRGDEIKKMSKKKKAELINSTNPGWHFLNESIYKAHQTFIVNKQYNATL